jgi:SOS response regulatory protein OraA/RecX
LHKKSSIQQIDEGEYLKTLDKLAVAKLNLLKAEKNIFIKKKKLQLYLQQKGFEMDLIKEINSRL